MSCTSYQAGMGELHLFIVWSGKRAMIWPGVKWTAKTFCGCYSEHKRSFRQTETRKHSLPLLCFIHRMIEKTVSHQSELRALIQSPAWTGLWLLYLAYVAVGLETSRHLYSMGLAVLETVLFSCMLHHIYMSQPACSCFWIWRPAKNSW